MASFSYSGASYNNGVAIGTASFNPLANSGMQIFGQTTNANSINIDEGAISSIYSSGLGAVFSGAGNSIPSRSETDFFQSVMAHEIGHSLRAVDMSGTGSNVMNQVGYYSISGVNDSGDITLPGTIDSSTSQWLVDRMNASNLQSGVVGDLYMKNPFITR